MPHNKLEIHPYLNCIKDQNFDGWYFENLIVGTFPIYSITDTLNVDNTIISRFDENAAFMRFFYGSSNNSFWKLFSEVWEAQNPTDLPGDQRKNAAMELLVNHKFLITDVVYKTNRKAESSQDNDLWVQTEDVFVIQNRSLNTGLVDLLNRNMKIKYLYFTATVLDGNSPFGWFQDIFGDALQYQIIQQVENRIVSASLTIKGKGYIAFFLPSPSGNGTRGLHFNNQRTQIFVNYLQSVNPGFYTEIDPIPKTLRTIQQKEMLTLLRKDFLIENWKQLIQLKNINYNGTI
jgi:hypothetical protein